MTIYSNLPIIDFQTEKPPAFAGGFSINIIYNESRYGIFRNGLNLYFVLFRVLNATPFSYDVNLDLTGIFEFAFNFLRDIFSKKHRLIIVDLIGFDHNSDFSARLNRERFFNAFKLRRDSFELFEPLDIIRACFAPCARSCAGDCVCRLNKYRLYALRFYVAVMRLNTVDDVFVLFVLLRKVYADLNMRAFDLEVDSLTDIVQ